MHVLQVLGFPPDRLGGTEIYVTELGRELAALGIGCTLVAPRAEDEPAISEHAGLPVEQYPVNAIPGADELRSGAAHRDFEGFRDVLRRRTGALYHQHSWTRGCGPRHLHAARAAGMRTLLTMHVAGNLCLRGDMMRFGRTPCHGRLDAAPCAACWSQSKGMPEVAAHAVSVLPLALSRAARNQAGRLATALSARALAADKQVAAKTMFDDSDRLIAVCEWVRQALLANGAPRDKVDLNRQGVSRAFLDAVAEAPPRWPTDGPLELLYLGSWNPLKGVDVVVRAMRALPSDVAARLTIHAPTGGREQQAYEQRVRNIAGQDSRIRMAGPVAHGAVAATMAAYDGLVAPSITLETGPLVALEAQAAGLFVLGSRLGGIAEIVTSPQAGMLVAPGDVQAWSEAIGALARRHGSGAPRAPRATTRTMAEVAQEMAQTYRRLAA